MIVVQFIKLKNYFWLKKTKQNILDFRKLTYKQKNYSSSYLVSNSFLNNSLEAVLRKFYTLLEVQSVTVLNTPNYSTCISSILLKHTHNLLVRITSWEQEKVKGGEIRWIRWMVNGTFLESYDSQTLTDMWVDAVPPWRASSLILLSFFWRFAQNILPSVPKYHSKKKIPFTVWSDMKNSLRIFRMYKKKKWTKLILYCFSFDVLVCFMMSIQWLQLWWLLL